MALPTTPRSRLRPQTATLHDARRLAECDRRERESLLSDDGCHEKFRLSVERAVDAVAVDDAPSRVDAQRSVASVDEILESRLL